VGHSFKPNGLSEKSDEELRLLISALSVELALLNPFSDERHVVQQSLDDLRQALDARAGPGRGR
jgi:hypothetical protein